MSKAEELAKQAGCYREDCGFSECSFENMETFRRLCIEAFMKGVDMEPVAWMAKSKIGGTESLIRARLLERIGRNDDHDYLPLVYAAPVAQHTELLRQALEALEQSNRFVWHYAYGEQTTAIAEKCDAAITKLKESLFCK